MALETPRRRFGSIAQRFGLMPAPAQSFAEIITASHHPQIAEPTLKRARRSWLFRFLIAPFADMDQRAVWRREKLRAGG
jgi:hypothetical protein